METIKKILEHLGYESVLELDINDSITLESGSDAIMDLTIERVSDDHLSVAHYWVQRGDLMADPEIVFDISGDEWTPIEHKVDPRFHRHNEDGLPESQQFATKTWDTNLQRQGFVDVAKQTDHQDTSSSK